MRTLLIQSAILIFGVSTTFAQLRVEITSAEYIDSSTLRVLTQIQNIGSRVMVFVPYGQAAIHINPNIEERDDIGILLRYRPQGVDRIVKNLPSSVTIKTLFGGSIGAEMFQEISSTGTTSYQLWEMIFSVPYNALNVSIDVFGTVHRIPDRKEAILLEQEATEKADRIIAEANTLVAEGKYEDALNRFRLAQGVEYRRHSEFGENYAEALYAVGSEQMNASNYETAAEYLSKAYRYAYDYGLPNELKITRKLAVAYIELGNINHEVSAYGDAFWFFQEAKRLDRANLEAQQGIRTIEQYQRNPVTATLLSIIPGLGQFYNRRTVEGVLFLAGGAFFTTAAAANLLAEENEQAYSYERSNSEKARNAFFGYGILAVWSMYRANSQAHSFNDKIYQQSNAVDKYRVALVPSSSGINFALRIQF